MYREDQLRLTLTTNKERRVPTRPTIPRKHVGREHRADDVVEIRDLVDAGQRAGDEHVSSSWLRERHTAAGLGRARRDRLEGRDVGAHVQPYDDGSVRLVVVRLLLVHGGEEVAGRRGRRIGNDGLEKTKGLCVKTDTYDKIQDVCRRCRLSNRYQGERMHGLLLGRVICCLRRSCPSPTPSCKGSNAAGLHHCQWKGSLPRLSLAKDSSCHAPKSNAPSRGSSGGHNEPALYEASSFYFLILELCHGACLAK